MAIFEHIIEIIFGFGLFLNAMLFLPQLFQLYKTKDTKGVSLLTFAGFNFIQIVTILHGYLFKDYVLMVGFIISLITGGAVTILIIVYRKKNFMENHSNVLKDLEKIIFSLPGHVYWLDRENFYQGCNKIQAEAYGLNSPREIVGKCNEDLSCFTEHPEVAHLLNETNLMVMREGRAITIEEPFIFRDNIEHTFLTQKIPLKDDKNQIVGVLGVSFDINEIKITEKKLEEKSQEVQTTLEHIMNHLPGHVYWKNKEGIYLGCNYRQAMSLGFPSPSNIIGKTDFELTSDISLANIFRQNDLDVMENERSVTAEEIIKVNDQLAIMLSQKVPLKNYKEEIIGVLGISIDITEKKKMENALQKAQGQVDGMALVSASIAHELRTPLAGIKSSLYCINAYLPKLIQSYYQALSHKLDIPSLGETSLQSLSDATVSINKKVDHSNMVIDMLLTNLAHDQINTEDFTQNSIAECVKQAMDRYTFPIGQKKWVKINIQKDFLFSGKPVLIMHILFNLLKNALYFIQKAGKGEIQIWTELSENANSLHFKDTAQGISADTLPHIFDQFFSQGTHHGTGIGLAFSKMVMRAHGGEITCQSVYGEYTDFILSFPLSPK